MAHFAKIENNIVVSVIVAEQEFIDSLEDKECWVQTSYNTFGGEHKLGGTPLRKNFAGLGYTYDPNIDAFIPPKPFNSWVLDELTCLWKPPIQEPENVMNFHWDESVLNWVESDQINQEEILE